MDVKAFLVINKQHSHLFDILMAYISFPWIWTPLYIVLMLICIKEFGLQSIHALLFVLILIGLTLLIDDDFIKTSVKRMAPICDPNLYKAVRLVKPMDNCHYAFVSAQAAFAIALFLAALLDSRYLSLKVIFYMGFGRFLQPRL